MPTFRVDLVFLCAAVLLVFALAALFSGPRYQITTAVDANGNSFVWRLDTRSGNVESCRLIIVDRKLKMQCSSDIKQ